MVVFRHFASAQLLADERRLSLVFPVPGIHPGSEIRGVPCSEPRIQRASGSAVWSGELAGIAHGGLGDQRPRRIIAYAVAHGDRYWTCVKIVALGLNLAGIAILQRMFKGKVWLFLFAVSIYFASTPAVFYASLTTLTNETFAIVIIPALYFLIYRLLAPDLDSTSSLGSGNELHSTLFLRRRDALSVAIGVLAAIGWSVKIYYMAPAFGLAVGLVAAAAMRMIKIQTVLRCIVHLGAGFLATVALVVYFIMGWEKFTNLIAWTLKMLSHTDRYGAGEEGFIQSGNALHALENITRSTNGTLPAIMVATIAAVLFVCVIRRGDRAFIRRNLPFVFSVIVGIFINFTGLLKHYSPHYALVLCASLSCLLLVLIDEKFPRPLVGVAGALMLGALALNLYHYSVGHFADVQKVAAVQRDLQKIEAPSDFAGGEARLGLFQPGQGWRGANDRQYAGSPFVAKAVYGDATAVDVVPTSDRSAKDWNMFLLQEPFPNRVKPSQRSIGASSISP